MPGRLILTAYAFAFLRPDGSWGAVQDDLGRLVCTQLYPVAVSFADRLRQRGVLLVEPTMQTPTQIADLILSAGTPAAQVPDKFMLIEAETVDADEAVEWASGLADRLPLRREAA